MTTALYVNLLAAGIIDPAAVVRVAREHAVSVAGTRSPADAGRSQSREEPADARLGDAEATPEG